MEKLMLEMISDIYVIFMTFVVFSLTVTALVVWIMLMINKKQEESFDEKYRRTRKHEGYKPRR
jgi:heme/copper-type cytochrome/quinol oxidase subunit 2